MCFYLWNTKLDRQWKRNFQKSNLRADVQGQNQPKMAVIQVLTAENIKMTFLSDVAPCSLTEVCRRLRDEYCLHRPDHGGSKHIRNVGKFLPHYMEQNPRR